MSVMVFPKRTRCQKCRKSLGATKNDPVYDGMFDTPKCAGIPVPATDAKKLDPQNRDHRQCITQRDGKWVWKRKYRAESEIPAHIKDSPSATSYRCGYCAHIHVGHHRINTDTETHSVLQDREAIAALLRKSRGNATLKQVAAGAGVRPVRIKEWEDPTFDTPSQAVLEALLRVYRLKLAVVFRQNRI